MTKAGTDTTSIGTSCLHLRVYLLTNTKKIKSCRRFAKKNTSQDIHKNLSNLHRGKRVQKVSKFDLPIVYAVVIADRH